MAASGTGPIVVVEYDPEWPLKFERLRARLSAALGDIATAIEHVGSTSVPGLAAKPIIDILALLSSADQMSSAIQRLAAAGYIHEGDLGIKGREAFANSPATGMHDHHLYVCPSDSAAYCDEITFRDYLRSHPESARDYSDLKHTLATRFRHDRAGYGQAKTKFILKVLQQAKG